MIGKTLAEMRTEIELGMKVYPSTNPSVYVYRGDGSYRLVEFVPNETPKVIYYKTFDYLLNDKPMDIVSQPVWSTSMTFEHKLEEKRQAELVKQREEQEKHSHQDLDEDTVPLDSQLWQDVAQYVAQHFPGSHVTKIDSRFHEGVFIGDYSIGLHVSLEHPNVQKVVISFGHQDVPSRPNSWNELVSLPGIELFMTRITLRNVGYGEDKSVTYSVPAMYEKEIEQWCNKQDDGELYSCTETPNMFIIATQSVDQEVLNQLKRHI